MKEKIKGWVIPFLLFLGIVVCFVVKLYFFPEKTCVEPEPCVCPTATPSATQATSSAIPTVSTTAAPKAPGRSSELSKSVSKEEKAALIEKEANPVKVKAELVFHGKLAGFDLELTNTTDKTITAFKGYVYGFDKVGDPMDIAFGDRFTRFVSLDDTKLPPGVSNQWYESYYKLGKGTTALVEVVKITFEDGSTWSR